MARSQFIYKPGYFLLWMREGIPQHHIDNVWGKMTFNDFQRLYDDLKPTREKILSKLQTAEDLTPAQEIIFYHLKNYIANANPEKMEPFLRYTTGSTTVPRE